MGVDGLNSAGINEKYFLDYVDSIKTPGRHYPSVSLDEAPRDVFVKKTDKSNDGKFSLLEAGKNFVKGVISPITTMFSSVTNFAIGAGIIAAGVALISAAPVMAIPLVALGLGMGAVTTGFGVYKLATAKNGDDAEKAFHNFGQAFFEIGGAMLGSGAALKGATLTTTANGTKAVRSVEIAKAIGVAESQAGDAAAVESFIQNMNTLQVIAASFKASGTSLKQGWAGLTGGSKAGAAASNQPNKTTKASKKAAQKDFDGLIELINKDLKNTTSRLSPKEMNPRINQFIETHGSSSPELTAELLLSYGMRKPNHKAFIPNPDGTKQTALARVTEMIMENPTGKLADRVRAVLHPDGATSITAETLAQTNLGKFLEGVGHFKTPDTLTLRANFAVRKIFSGENQRLLSSEAHTELNRLLISNADNFYGAIKFNSKAKANFEAFDTNVAASGLSPKEALSIMADVLPQNKATRLAGAFAKAERFDDAVQVLDSMPAEHLRAINPERLRNILSILKENGHVKDASRISRKSKAKPAATGVEAPTPAAAAGTEAPKPATAAAGTEAPKPATATASAEAVSPNANSTTPKRKPKNNADNSGGSQPNKPQGK